MEIFVGTSGYAYPAWKGDFYGEDVTADTMLGAYAERFGAVELNNTFYRVPKKSVVAGWAEATPGGFSISLKASRRITHLQRLRASEELETSLFYVHQSSLELGTKLGAVLFQLPPFLQKDLPLLVDFLALLPKDWPVTLEFRHASWFSDDVYAALAARDVPLCISDGEKLSSPLIPTATWGYFRLRRQDYDLESLESWLARVREPAWRRALVFFKHEETPPRGALEFQALVRGSQEKDQ